MYIIYIKINTIYITYRLGKITQNLNKITVQTVNIQHCKISVKKDSLP